MTRRSAVIVAPTDLRDQVVAILRPIGIPQADPSKRIAGWHVTPVRDDGSVCLYWVPFGGAYSAVMADIKTLLDTAHKPLVVAFGAVVKAEYWIEVSNLHDLAPYLQQTEMVV